MRLLLTLPILALSSPLLAQELTFDFGDDSLYVEDTVTETVSSEPASNFEFSAVLGYTYSGIAPAFTDSVAMQLNMADQYNLGGLGFLDWAGNILVSDIGGANDTSLNLHRIHLQNSAGDFSWKLGKYRIGWGEVEGAPVLDIVNSGLSLASVGLDSDELPGQWFLGLDYFASSATVSGFIGVAPEVDHATYTVAANPAQYEAGIQVKLPITNGEISLYGAYLLPQAGVVNLGSMESHATPYSLVGISGNYTIGNVMLELDLAGKFGLQRSTLAGLVSDDRVDAAIGFEYAATSSMQITTALVAQYWLDDSQPYYVPLGVGNIVSPQASLTYIFGISDSFMNGNLSLSANALGAADFSMNAVIASADYSISDTWKLSASAMGVVADPASLMGMLDGFRQYGLTVTYYY